MINSDIEKRPVDTVLVIIENEINNPYPVDLYSKSFTYSAARSKTQGKNLAFMLTFFI